MSVSLVESEGWLEEPSAGVIVADDEGAVGTVEVGGAGRLQPTASRTREQNRNFGNECFRMSDSWVEGERPR